MGMLVRVSMDASHLAREWVGKGQGTLEGNRRGSMGLMEG